MMMYVIQGNPIPLARARIGHGSRKMYDSQHEAKILQGIYLDNQRAGRPIYTGPLHLDVTFYLKMPKLSERKVIERNNTYHYYRPDLSNLIKFIEDVANEILYKDDAQICVITSRKLYHENPRTEFSLIPLKKEDKYENKTT